MASESSGLWNNLPSIIIVEIFSFLSLKDRLHASSVCKNWRNNLFHPKLWHKVVFQLNSCDKKTVNHSCKFLAKHCGRFVREAVIQVNSSNPKDVQLCKDVLRVLTHNNNLRALSIKPLSSRLEWQDYDDTLSLDQYVDCLVKIIERAHSLEHLSLGCIEELLDFSEYFLGPLAERHSASLRSLHLSSVKEVPGSYFVTPFDPGLFTAFAKLERLSIDYDYVDDRLLDALSHSHRQPLKQLSIHVHSYDNRCKRVSDEAWQRTSRNTNLELTLTLLHLTEDPTGLLSPEMPLTHFRVYFSAGFNPNVLWHVARLNNCSLRSLVLVDELMDGWLPIGSFLLSAVDPLVMLAWRCTKLASIKIIGYEVGADSLIAISRLRGEQLKELQIPTCCICTAQLEENMLLSKEEVLQHLHSEVSYSLQRYWQPLELNELPLAVCYGNVDADGVYLQDLLRDQQW